MEKKKARLTPVDDYWLSLNPTRIHYNFFELSRALREARRVVNPTNGAKPPPSKRSRVVYKANPEYVKRTRSLVKKEDHALEQLPPVGPSPQRKQTLASMQEANAMILEKFNKSVSSIESLIKTTKASNVYPVDAFTIMSTKLQELTQLLDQEIATVDHTRYIADYINQQVGAFGQERMNEVIKTLGTPLKFDMSQLQDLPPVKEKLEEMVCDDDTVNDYHYEELDSDQEEVYHPTLAYTDITSLPDYINTKSETTQVDYLDDNANL